MLAQNTVQTSSFTSSLDQGRRLKAIGGKSEKKGHASLMLTSLVDTFAVMVIFLMMNASTSYNVKLDQGIKLPAATAGHPIEKAAILKIKNGQFFLNDEPVGIARLAQAIYQISSTKVADDAPANIKQQYKSLIVVADKNMNYDELNPVIKAASAAGITEFKFAVLPKKN